MKRIIFLITCCICLIPISTWADAAIPPGPKFYSVTQQGGNVQLLVDSIGESSNISIDRVSESSSKLVVDNVPFNSLTMTDIPSDYYYYYSAYVYEVIDECVPPGETEYTLYVHQDDDDPWCSAESIRIITVTDEGQECEETTSDFSCPTSQSSDGGCSVLPGRTELALPFLMLFIGLVALMLSRRGARQS